LITTPIREKITLGATVQIILKQDQRTGNLTEGTVKRILTSSNFHPHGIKVELSDGQIGRVQKILQSKSDESETNSRCYSRQKSKSLVL